MDQQLWKGINKDILHLILKYDGSIIERNGMYMNRIPIHDERYTIIKNIPPKKYYKNDTFVYFQNKKFFIGFIESPQSIKFIFFRGSMSWTTYLFFNNSSKDIFITVTSGLETEIA